MVAGERSAPVPGATLSKRRIILRLLFAGLLLALACVAAGWWYRTTRPDYRLRQGLDALKRSDVNRAEQLVQQLEAAGATDHAHLLHAAIHLDLGRPNEAVARFNQIEAIEQRLEAAILYGEWLVRQQTQPAEAERLFRFVLSERPDEMVAHRGLAAIYYDQGAWTLAVLHLIRWGELDPKDGRPYRFIGLIYKDMDQPNPAIEAYKEALHRDLTPAVIQEVREELAECLTTQSLFAEALEVLGQCGSRAEQVPRLLALRGECLAGTGRKADAETLLDRALERFPNTLELLRTRGKLFAESGKPEEAAGLFERALRQDAHDITSRYQLTLAYERLMRTDEAAKHRQAMEQTRQGMLALTKLIQEAGEKPWDAALHRRLAEQCEKMQRPDLARRWLRSAGIATTAVGRK